MLDRVEDAAAGGRLPTDASRVSPAVNVPADMTVLGRYDQLLAKLARAERELEARTQDARADSLVEASAIVFDLLYALDFRRGGEVVPRLAALYGYLGNELLSVGRTGDKRQLAHLRDMITTLKQSWREDDEAV